METCMKATGSMITPRDKDVMHILMEKVDLMNHMSANGKMVKCTEKELTHLKMETYMWASMTKVKSKEKEQ